MTSTHLSITNRVPWAVSSELKPSRGGSSVTDTFSSLWRNTAWMSLNDVGVEATRFLCSSKDTKVGILLIRTAAGI